MRIKARACDIYAYFKISSKELFSQKRYTKIDISTLCVADLKRDYTTGSPRDAIIMAIAVSKISKMIFSTKFRRRVALLFVLSNQKPFTKIDLAMALV